MTPDYHQPYLVSTWDATCERMPLGIPMGPMSLDAAREVASTHAAFGYVARIGPAQDPPATDWWEVYSRDGIRRGTFAQTTLVHVPAAAPKGA